METAMAEECEKYSASVKGERHGSVRVSWRGLTVRTFEGKTWRIFQVILLQGRCFKLKQYTQQTICKIFVSSTFWQKTYGQRLQNMAKRSKIHSDRAV
jgi:hypothetical protein